MCLSDARTRGLHQSSWCLRCRYNHEAGDLAFSLISPHVCRSQTFQLHSSFFFLIFGCCRDVLQLWRAGAALGCSAQASHRGASLVAEQSTGSRAQTQSLRSMWDLPGLGIEFRSAALVAGTLNHWTTREAPQLLQFLYYLGKSRYLL